MFKEIKDTIILVITSTILATVSLCIILSLYLNHLNNLVERVGI